MAEIRYGTGLDKDQAKDQEALEARILYCSLFALFVNGLCAQPLGSFLPFLREAYGFSYSFSGMLLSAQSIGNLITTMVAGILPLYFGRRNAISLTAVWMAVAWLLFASGIGAWPLLLAACFMTGISRGGNTTFCNTQVSGLPEKKAARGYNLLHGVFAAGALISPALLVLMTRIFQRQGWRIMAVILAFFAILGIVDYRTMPMLPDPEKKGVRNSNLSFVRKRMFWAGAFMLFFYISVEYSVVGWLVTYFQDIGLLGQDSSQMMSTLFWVMMFSGRMLGAVISGRVSRMKLLLLDSIGCILSCMLILRASSTLEAVIGIGGCALFMATVYPTAFACGSSAVAGNDLGVAVMTMFGSFGGIITPYLIGILADARGIRSGMGLLLVYFLLLFAAVLAAALADRIANKRKQ